MSQPTPYTPNADFSQQEANNASGRSTVNTAAIDAEFAAIETTLDQTLANIQLLQRDDGQLKDTIVSVMALDQSVISLMGGWTLKGAWLTVTNYAVNDIVSSGEYTYVCLTAHQSGIEFDSQYWSRFGFAGSADAAIAAGQASASAASAATSATTATTKAASATASATAAATSSGNAASHASTATTKAGEAAASATNAANSAAKLPNLTAAGANKVVISNDLGSAWEYKTYQDMVDEVDISARGAEQIGYLPAGTGAVATNIQSVLRRMVSVKDFGAVGDGVANDTLAIQAAIDAASGRVIFPAGIYNVTSLSWAKNNITLIGDGEGATTIRGLSSTADIITISTSSNCSVERMTITSSVIRTSGAAIRLRDSHCCRISNIRLLENMYWGIQLDGGVNQYLYFIDHIEINSGSVGVVVGGDGTQVQGVWIKDSEIFSCSSSGIILKHCGGVYLNELDLLTCNHAIKTFPDSGELVKAVFFTRVVGDSSASHGFNFVTNGGTVSDVSMIGCWGATNGSTTSHHGINIDQGAGSIRGIEITGFRAINNYGNGAYIGNSTDVTISNPQFVCNSVATTGAKHGIEVAAGVSQWSISGGVCGQGGEFLTNKQGYGIFINDGASSYYTISDVNTLGNVTKGIYDGGSGDDKHIHHNIGFRTNNNGVAMISPGATNTTVTHYMDTTPLQTQCFCQPTSDLGAVGAARYWIDNVTSTTFRINVNAAVTGSQYFGWSVRAKGD